MRSEFVEQCSKSGNECRDNEYAAEYVREPVNTGEETPEGNNESEESNDEVYHGDKFGFDVVTGEEDGGASKCEGEKNMGGRVRRLKDAVNENGAVIDDEKFFEKDVDGGDGEIDKGEEL